MGLKIRPRRRNIPRRGMDLGRDKTLGKGKAALYCRRMLGRVGGRAQVPSEIWQQQRTPTFPLITPESLGLFSSKRLLNKTREAQYVSISPKKVASCPGAYLKSLSAPAPVQVMHVFSRSLGRSRQPP